MQTNGSTMTQAVTTILTVRVGTSSLMAVVRDPAIRLRIRLDGVGETRTRCVVDGVPVVMRPTPINLEGAIHLVADLIRFRGLDVTAVAHHVEPSAGAGPADTGIMATMQSVWPDAVYIAYSGDDEELADREARELLGRSPRGSSIPAGGDRDHRADQMLTDPQGYFAEARERARTEVRRDVTAALHRRRR